MMSEPLSLHPYVSTSFCGGIHLGKESNFHTSREGHVMIKWRKVKDWGSARDYRKPSSPHWSPVILQPSTRHEPISRTLATAVPYLFSSHPSCRRYQIILPGGRSSRVRENCPGFLCSGAAAECRRCVSRNASPPTPLHVTCYPMLKRVSICNQGSCWEQCWNLLKSIQGSAWVAGPQRTTETIWRCSSKFIVSEAD